MAYKENLAVFKQSKQIISQVNERTILAALQEQKKQNPDSDGEEVNIDLVFANPIPVTLTDDCVGIFRTDLCDTPALPITYQDSVNDFLSRTADILSASISDMRNAIVHCNTSDSETDYTKLNEQILQTFLEWLRNVPSLISALAALNDKLHHHPALSSV